MKQFKHLLFIIIFSTNAFSQENYIKHTVVKGESIYQISKKYNVKPETVFKLNTNVKKVLKLNSVLLIPNDDIPNILNTTTIIHEVLPKQTLYSISKQYGVSIKDIKKSNPIIEREGLEMGLKLTIPRKEAKPEVAILTEKNNEFEQNLPQQIVSQEAITHNVLPKETRYGIAKHYGMTIQELETLNPEILKELPIGHKLLIRKSTGINENIPVEEVKGTTIETIPVKTNDTIGFEKPIVANPELLDKLVVTASDNIGVRYKSGGISKSGFDCSGLMITIFKTHDVQLPRTSAEQSNFGIPVSVEQAQIGDLIFFSTNGRGNINHVGMITEITDEEVKFIHASVHGGVMISSNKEVYYSKRFVKINRVLQ
ncbi:NlpC/P60 family protein [Flavobacterium sp.]|uniref:C40 family peptidase n=1 Tax=Flavobacterium sp. TaxID=239 RepID=UPI00286E41B6|nr:NlpC/P60 family protein [Flavobacterium sp.]